MPLTGEKPLVAWSLARASDAQDPDARIADPSGVGESVAEASASHGTTSPAGSPARFADIGALHPDAIEAVVQARHGDPFAILGPHRVAPETWELRAFLPWADRVAAVSPGGDELAALWRAHPAGFFVGRLVCAERPTYILRIEAASGAHLLQDPYRFAADLDGETLRRIRQDGDDATYRFLGAHQRVLDGVSGFPLRRLGAQRPARQRGRRFQRLGRPPASDAAAPRRRRLGSVRARHRARPPLQVRDPLAGRGIAAQGRPGRFPRREAARYRLGGGGPVGDHVARRGLDGRTRRRRSACETDLDL